MFARRDGPAEAFSDREIVTERVFDAPRELVFSANEQNPDRLAAQLAKMAYESFGFHRIPAFGEYANDTTSVCYEKRVAPIDLR
jgi:hypothetical protein